MSGEAVGGRGVRELSCGQRLDKNRDGRRVAGGPRSRMSVKIAPPTLEFIAKSLRRCPAFSVLSDSQIARLASSTVAAKLPSGEVIYRRGDPAAGFYLVVAGTVRLDADGDGGANHQDGTGVLGPGECFGELDVLEDSPRAATAVVLDDASVVAFDRGDFELLLLRSPDLLRQILDSLEAHLSRRDGDPGIRRLS